MVDVLNRIVPPPPRRVGVVLLALGLLVGSLMGPAFLGRLGPSRYERLFVGGAAERAAVAAHDRETAADLDRLRAVGVTDVAIDERAARAAEQREDLEQAVDAATRQRAAVIDRLRLAVTLCVVLAAALVVLGVGRWTYVALAAAAAAWIALALAVPPAW